LHCPNNGRSDKWDPRPVYNHSANRPNFAKVEQEDRKEEEERKVDEPQDVKPVAHTSECVHQWLQSISSMGHVYFLR